MKLHTICFLSIIAVNAAFAQSEQEGCYWNSCNSGFGPCVPGWVCPTQPPSQECLEESRDLTQICFVSLGCFPVSYQENGYFLVAKVTLPIKFDVLGWAGPCAGPISSCTDIKRQAYDDLRTNAMRAMRAFYQGE